MSIQLDPPGNRHRSASQGSSRCAMHGTHTCETQKREAGTDSEEVPLPHSTHPDSQAAAQRVSVLESQGPHCPAWGSGRSLHTWQAHGKRIHQRHRERRAAATALHSLYPAGRAPDWKAPQITREANHHHT